MLLFVCPIDALPYLIHVVLQVRRDRFKEELAGYVRQLAEYEVSTGKLSPTAAPLLPLFDWENAVSVLLCMLHACTPWHSTAYSPMN